MTHNDKVMARILASGLDISASMERDRIVKKINELISERDSSIESCMESIKGYRKSMKSPSKNWPVERYQEQIRENNELIERASSKVLDKLLDFCKCSEKQNEDNEHYREGNYDATRDYYGYD